MFYRKTPPGDFVKTHSMFLNSATVTNLPIIAMSVGGGECKVKVTNLSPNLKNVAPPPLHERERTGTPDQIFRLWRCWNRWKSGAEIGDEYAVKYKKNYQPRLPTVNFVLHTTLLPTTIWCPFQWCQTMRSKKLMEISNFVRLSHRCIFQKSPKVRE